MLYKRGGARERKRPCSEVCSKAAAWLVLRVCRQLPGSEADWMASQQGLRDAWKLGALRA